MIPLQKQNAAEAGPLDGAQDEDFRALSLSYPMGPLTSHLECEHLGAGFPSREALAALRGAGVSQAVLLRHPITQATVRFLPRRRWEFDAAGRQALLLAASDGFGGVADLVAWPADRPDKWARLTARATLLNEEALAEPNLGRPVWVFRTPLSWLVAGATGIVILDAARSWRVLHHGPDLCGEDLEHAQELRRIMAPPGPTARVSFRNSRKAEAA